MEETKTPRRRGKGKHNKGTQRVLFQVSCQPEEREAIKQLAKEKGVTVSSLIISSVLGK